MLIDARLRHDRGWSDALILNISRRGIMARSPQPPQRGAYVEIRRGPHQIVARVVWAKNGEFGVHSQDPIAIDSVILGSGAPAPAGTDRRSERRIENARERHESSRIRSRALEFFVIVAAAVAAGLVAFDSVRETLSRPLDLVEARLGKQG